ncbi:MAG: YjgP/YjgQ family permease [Spirochaetaceae bacterium]|nr:MAG: YjgP/YjgQ family permease [Spirochaetaceae bacterium]
MTTRLHAMLIRGFFPVFVIATVFFVTILQLVDLFENITRYIDLEVSFAQIAVVQLLYLPRSVHFALPMSLLFAVSFTLGTLYSNNELIAVFGSGVSLRAFVAPLVAGGLLFSAGSFVFHERVVIDTFVEKTRLERELLNITTSASNTDVTRLGSAARRLYHAGYYNDATTTLSSVILIERDPDGALRRIVHARSARWDADVWTVQNARFFDVSDDGIVERSVGSQRMEGFDLPPSAFGRTSQSIDELRIADARAFVETQRMSGLPFRQDLTKLYSRYSFALTPFVVILIATAIGGRFKKNILLMSLLVSLCVSVVYYVAQMVSELLAYSGLISPLFGAWFGVGAFIVIGASLLQASRT